MLEARCRAPSTAQRDVKRARVVLLAAQGRSTRSIAAEVGYEVVQRYGGSGVGRCVLVCTGDRVRTVRGADAGG